MPRTKRLILRMPRTNEEGIFGVLADRKGEINSRGSYVEGEISWLLDTWSILYMCVCVCVCVDRRQWMPYL